MKLQKNLFLETEDSTVLLQKIAEEKFGIKYIFPWQQLVMSNILDSFIYKTKEDEYKNDIDDCEYLKGRQIVLLPTGAGKSLCFQLPALMLPGPTLAIYPLLALMADQKRRLEEKGITCAVIKGGQSEDERNEIYSKIKNKSVKFIIANPEVLCTNGVCEKLSDAGISHIAIDEAHCVSEWGKSFRPSYLELGKIIKKINSPVVTAFTATASPEILKDISDILFEGNSHLVKGESDRPNIHYSVIKSAIKKKNVLELCLQEEKPLIIFCGTRNSSEDMSREINAFFNKEVSKFYHAGLEKEEKDKTEKWFFKSHDGILCATCAYGMGIDKSDIRTVIHLECSENAESYIQEAGRGGRDGKISKAILLWSLNDSMKFGENSKNHRMKVMKTFAESQKCRRSVLLETLNGEETETACSGCDICDGFVHKKTDYEKAFDLIKRQKNHFTKEEFIPFFTKKMNEEYIKKIGKNIWTNKDSGELLDELLKNKKIKENSKFFGKRLCIVKVKKSEKTKENSA